MRKTALRLSISAVAIPVAELALNARGWLLDGQVRQLSPNTTAARKFLIEKLLWFLRQREYPACGTAELHAFLAYVSTAHETEEGRWVNPRLERIVRPRTAATSYGNLEGRVNRLKMIKRQLFGRASMLVLRARIKPATKAA